MRTRTPDTHAALVEDMCVDHRVFEVFVSEQFLYSSDVVALRHTITGLGTIEGSHAGDSDGNGRREFLIAQESFPSRVRIFEATSDKTFHQT